ncbi:MAG TPA: HAD-IA family hydrolase [Humisphaera sp.]
MSVRPPIRFVIFDSDGVLVDSEALGTRALVEEAAKYGYDVSVADGMPIFRGLKMAESFAIIERRIGRPLPASFAADYRAVEAGLFEQHLRAVPGVEAVLRALAVPFCVASNGPRAKIDRALRVTGLAPLFGEGRVFCAYEVGSWKPDPGLFLAAARHAGVPPAACAVVEDSRPGVRAGLAAGMQVFGFAATDEAADELAAEGAQVVRTMSELQGWLPTRAG